MYTSQDNLQYWYFQSNMYLIQDKHHVQHEAIMSTLTKKHLVINLVKNQGFDRKLAKEFVDAFFNEMASTLENGFDIKLDGFGNFVLADKKERMALNPRTKEKALVSARRVVTLRTGEKIKNYVQNKLSTKQKFKPKFFEFSNEYIKGLYILDEDIFDNAVSPGERYIPFVKDIKEIVSNDDKLFSYKNLIGKPDFVAKSDSNKIYFVEFKAKSYLKCSEELLSRHILQSIVCAYAYSKSSKINDNSLYCVLRFLDAAFVIENPNKYFEYIDYILTISSHIYKEGKIPSKVLAMHIHLTAKELKASPMSKEESEIKGELIHQMAATYSAIPKFNASEKPIW